jgi:hypothetical protein
MSADFVDTGCAADDIDPAMREILDDLLEQLFPGREVIVKRRRGHARALVAGHQVAGLALGHRGCFACAADLAAEVVHGRRARRQSP